MSEEKIQVKSSATVAFEVKLILTEGEARALDAICGYGPDEFVKWFYKNLGKHYLQPHEKDMRSLFATVRTEMGNKLSLIDKAKKAISEIK